MEQRPNPALRDMPERLGRYRLVRPLSKGGMAHVFEGRRESLAGVSPRVAIKLILPEYAKKEGFQELFINEARLGASMHHQNLVQIQDFDRDGDNFYLVMEYVEGLTLRRIISLCARHGHPIPLGVIAEIGRQACDGLHYAHAAKDESGRALGLVHRDMKPSNLILNPQGVVKVLDFGISKGPLLAERKGAVKGTWGYMAPEQAHGHEVGPEADQFGLGIVLWELAVREGLFPQGANEQILALLDGNHGAKAVDRIDPSYGGLRNVLLRAMSHHPGGRYASASDMGRELASLSPDPITARDEAVRFFQRLDALDRGKPLPAQTGRPATGSSAGSQASLVQTGGAVASSPGQPLGMVLLTSVGLGLIAVGGVALVLVIAFGLQFLQVGEEPGVADALPDVPAPLAADEPGGPAAEGAPGELRPAPAALRGQEEPRGSRPPPTTSVQTPSGSGSVASSSSSAPVAAAPPEEARVEIDRTKPPEPVAEPETVVVHTPEPAAAPPPPAGFGKVYISAVQPGFEVWIDGEMVKKGAVAGLKLPAGPHRVTLFSAEGRRYDLDIDVPVDGEVRKTWDFARNELRR